MACPLTNTEKRDLSKKKFFFCNGYAETKMTSLIVLMKKINMKNKIKILKLF